MYISRGTSELFYGLANESSLCARRPVQGQLFLGYYNKPLKLFLVQVLDPYSSMKFLIQAEKMPPLLNLDRVSNLCSGLPERGVWRWSRDCSYMNVRATSCHIRDYTGPSCSLLEPQPKCQAWGSLDAHGHAGKQADSGSVISWLHQLEGIASVVAAEGEGKRRRVAASS